MQAAALDRGCLLQKIHGRDIATGDECGIFLFENQAALAALRETELAKANPSAYEEVEIRREIYDVLYPLHAGRGPFATTASMPTRAAVTRADDAGR